MDEPLSLMLDASVPIGVLVGPLVAIVTIQTASLHEGSLVRLEHTSKIVGLT